MMATSRAAAATHATPQDGGTASPANANLNLDDHASYNRKRQRLLSNGSSNPQMIPKKQHYAATEEVINLDSEDEDYVFNGAQSSFADSSFNMNSFLQPNIYQRGSNMVNSSKTDHNNNLYLGHSTFTSQHQRNFDNSDLLNDDVDVVSNNATDVLIDDDFGDAFEYDDHARYANSIEFPMGNQHGINNNNANSLSRPFHFHNIANEHAIIDLESDEDHADADDDNHDGDNDDDDDDDDDEVDDDEDEDDDGMVNDEEVLLSDPTIDDDDTYSNYFESYDKNQFHQKQGPSMAQTTRHLSLAGPINKFFHRILKKKGKDSGTSLEVTSPPLSSSSSLTSKKRRTKSLPQLAYAKMTYSPALDANEVSMKIGDIHASLIQRYAPNYTYDYSKPSNHSNNFRKFSFQTQTPNQNENRIQIQNRNQSNKSSISTNKSHSSTSNSTATSFYDEKISSHSKKDSNNLFDMDHIIPENETEEKSSSSNVEDERNEEEICDDDDGYYIVKNGAPFANGRFIIKKLLGQGTFGKVVKAYDHQTNSMVAIKIIKSIPKYREASKTELRVLTMLKKHDPHNKFQCIHLRECFDYRDHICIVTDLLKISLYDFMEKNDFLPFPGSHIQAMSKQLLRSVAFLHDLNLIHTDLKPENILIKDSAYCKKPYSKPNEKESIFRKILKDPKIYLIDFGSAIFQDEYHSSVISTRHYRAPEIILGVGWSFPCDLWSVGSVLIELLTGEALFKTHENEQHLAMMEKVTGVPVDVDMVRQCISLYRVPNKNFNTNSRFDPSIAKAFSKRTNKLLFPKSNTDRKLVEGVDQLLTIEEMVEDKVGFKYNLQLSPKESLKAFGISNRYKDEYIFWYHYIDLIKKLLVFDPEKRLTARDALKHEWFNYGIHDDGI